MVGSSLLVNEIWNFLTSSTFIAWAGSIGASVVACCFKRVRDAIKKAPSKVAEAFRPAPHAITEEDNLQFGIIQQELTEIRLITGAARVAIWQFHNGERFTMSNPVFKFRSTFEILREGVAPDITVADDVLVTKCQNVIGPILDVKSKSNGVTDVTPKADKANTVVPCRVVKIDYKTLDYGWFKYFMDQNGNDRVYAMLLRTVSGHNMGIMTIQFINIDAQEGMLDEKLMKVFPSFQRVQFALDKTK